MAVLMQVRYADKKTVCFQGDFKSKDYSYQVCTRPPAHA